MHVHAADLELFFAIHQGGAITQAATMLGLSQSTVSRRLAELEARLGASLFLRSRDGVHLTALGADWVAPARACWSTARAAERACIGHLGADLVAEVTITSVHMVTDHVIAPALPTLFAAHPHLRVRLLSTGQVMDIARSQADIAVRLMRPQVGDLVAQRISQQPVVPVANAEVAARLADRPPVSWPWLNVGDLRQQPPPVSAWQTAHGVVPRLVLNSGASQLVAVQSGVGVGWVVEQLRRDLGLVALPTADLPRFEVSLWMTTHRAQRDLPHIDVVWRWLEGLFKDMHADAPAPGLS